MHGLTHNDILRFYISLNIKIFFFIKYKNKGNDTDDRVTGTIEIGVSRYACFYVFRQGKVPFNQNTQA